MGGKLVKILGKIGEWVLNHPETVVEGVNLATNIAETRRAHRAEAGGEAGREASETTAVQLAALETQVTNLSYAVMEHQDIIEHHLVAKEELEAANKKIAELEQQHKALQATLKAACWVFTFGLLAVAVLAFVL